MLQSKIISQKTKYIQIDLINPDIHCGNNDDDTNEQQKLFVTERKILQMI